MRVERKGKKKNEKTTRARLPLADSGRGLFDFVEKALILRNFRHGSTLRW
jgi:hypothetical protein